MTVFCVFLLVYFGCVARYLKRKLFCLTACSPQSNLRFLKFELNQAESVQSNYSTSSDCEALPLESNSKWFQSSAEAKMRLDQSELATLSDSLTQPGCQLQLTVGLVSPWLQVCGLMTCFMTFFCNQTGDCRLHELAQHRATLLKMQLPAVLSGSVDLCVSSTVCHAISFYIPAGHVGRIWNLKETEQMDRAGEKVQGWRWRVEHFALSERTLTACSLLIVVFGNSRKQFGAKQLSSQPAACCLVCTTSAE